METVRAIQEAKEFLQKNYLTELSKAKTHGRYIVLDFIKLARHNPDLADNVIEDYHEAQKYFEIAAEQIEGMQGMTIRFKNITPSQGRQIWKLRKEDVDKLIVIKGFVRKISDVIHGVSIIRWECPSCGTMIPVLQGKTLSKPTKCGCGRERGFRVQSRDIFDLQKLVLEEDPQELESATQKPRRIMVTLKNDLCREEIDKNLQPSYKIQITGLLKDIPLKANSTEYKKYIEAEHIDLLDQSYETIQFTEEEVNQFKALATSETFYDDMPQSIFPTIYGHQTAKLAIFLQLIGGVHISSPEGLFEERGTIHVLLVASPGCLAQGTYITTSKGEFKRIESYGSKPFEKINELISLEKPNANSPSTAQATMFHIYPHQKTIKITTETGKEIVCNLIHPFWTKRGSTKGWIKAENLRLGDKLKVVRKTQCNKTTYEKYQNITCDEEMGLVCGLAIGDGSVSKYRLSYHFCEDELECIDKVKGIFKEKFNKLPTEQLRLIPKSKIGDRVITRTKRQHILQYNSKDLASFFDMEKQPLREIPDWVMLSKNSVVSNFIKGLLESDGCCTIIKDAPRIQLKSTSKKLLLQTQLLLTRFKIQARVYINTLNISRSEDIITYNNEIGFLSSRKKNKLMKATKLANIPKRQRRNILYEKIVDICDAGIQTVYDISVEKAHKYISNSLVSHNTAKTQMLRKAIQYLPNSRFTGGRGTSGVGLVAAVVKDEELGGYSLEAGAMPMANKSILAIDELDKIDKNDIAMMNNAMVDLKVNIDKANIHGVLATDTIILGAANPTNRVFDNREPIWKQIGLPKDFLDRFDLVFPLDNIKSEEAQRKVASIIFSKYNKTEKSQPKYSVAFVRKYIAYARQYIKPKLNSEVEAFITDNFVNLVRPSQHVDEDESAYFSTRLLTNIIRLSTAAAKARLSELVEVEDAKIAIDILIESLKQQQIINTQGLIDIEKCEAIMPKKKRDARYVIKEIIEELCKNSKDHLAVDRDVLRVAINDHGMEEVFVDEMIKKMLHVGDITEPSVCKYKILN